MLKSVVLRHFGGNGAQVARALGIGRQAVQKWPRRVPLLSALRLERVTAGVLKVDWADYDLRPRRQPKPRGGFPHGESAP
jgi:transcriptional regulator with XRE-family HTH domain